MNLGASKSFVRQSLPKLSNKLNEVNYVELRGRRFGSGTNLSQTAEARQKRLDRAIQFINSRVSSIIAGVEYDKKFERLTIALYSGGVYKYLGVPENVVYEMANAPSLGQWFNRFKNYYAFIRVA